MVDAFVFGKELVTGKFDLLCPKMELKICPSYHTTVMVGNGEIRSNRHGDLSFRMTGNLIGTVFPEVLMDGKEPGLLNDIDDHVMLVATDAYGREWRSNPLLIHMNPTEIVHGYVCRSVDSLMHCYERPHEMQSRVELYFPKQERVPFDCATTDEKRIGDDVISSGWSIDHHVRIIDDAKVTIREREDKWISVTAWRDRAFLPDWAGLMCQAMSFAAAEKMRPTTVVRAINDRVEIGLYSGSSFRLRSIMPRPIMGLASSDSENYWLLVEKLFLHLQRNDNTCDSIIRELEAIRGGAAMPIETAALTLAVGIEALTSTLLPRVEPSGWNRSAASDLVAHIELWQGDEATRRRILGWMTSTGRSRPIDQLYAWASQIELDHSLVEAWKDLRNRRAHGVSFQDNQPLVDRYYATIDLLYSMICWKIGFKGEISKAFSSS